MKKKPIRIYDAYGKKIFQIYVEDPSKGFSGISLDAFHAPYAKLPAMDFSGCQMYWPLLEGADLSFCNFQGAVLAGANLKHSVLRNVNFRNARFVADALGYRGTLLGADLTGVLLEGVDLQGVEYDSSTVFPDGFDPDRAGMTFLPSNDG
jgi:uncharacterized protein YjbI with pentapeptide repeats